jgi:class 3 adenylate cyclase
LIVGSAAGELAPGVSFEEIARIAAQSGVDSTAGERGEEWITQTIEAHREPGPSRLFQSRNGRWLMWNERRTSDGGTVSIYADVTDLKRREEELARKSNTLERVSNQLAKYLSPQVYDSIFYARQDVKIASKRKRLTVFFSDLVGFTETTERLESEDLTNLLNQYLTEMSSIALAHGATIDKYMGDAILIFFGDPETRGVREDALACVKMAIAMRQRMHELQEVWRASGLETPLQCRTGINTGICTVGNFGSENRMEYTILGGGVNLAARLETACEPNEILISYETYAHVKDHVLCEEKDKIFVKGISHPISTYRVVDLYDTLAENRVVIRTHKPHFQLQADVSRMTEDEKLAAIDAIRNLTARLK